MVVVADTCPGGTCSEMQNIVRCGAWVGDIINASVGGGFFICLFQSLKICPSALCACLSPVISNVLECCGRLLRSRCRVCPISYASTPKHSSAKWRRVLLKVEIDSAKD